MWEIWFCIVCVALVLCDRHCHCYCYCSPRNSTGQACDFSCDVTQCRQCSCLATWRPILLKALGITHFGFSKMTIMKTKITWQKPSLSHVITLWQITMKRGMVIQVGLWGWSGIISCGIELARRARPQGRDSSARQCPKVSKFGMILNQLTNTSPGGYVCGSNTMAIIHLFAIHGHCVESRD